MASSNSSMSSETTRPWTCRARMNPRSVAVPRKASSSSKKPLTLRMPQRLSWIPSCAQVTASMNSSQVPKPPGSMTKASESSDISAFRSCMVCHDVEVVQCRVCDLVPGQGLGDDPGGPAARGQGGIGDHAHQSDGGAAVDEPDATAGEARSQPFGGSRRTPGRYPGWSRRTRRQWPEGSRRAPLGDRCLGPAGSDRLRPPAPPHDGLRRVAVVNGEGEDRRRPARTAPR